MEHLSPLDSAFLEVEDEDPNASLAIASVAVIEGPAPDQQDFVDAITARLALIPRYRQKVREVPLDLGPPVWVEDDDFVPAHHFRRVALPGTRDEKALLELVALLMSERLDRDRPLWECWVIEGLSGDRWALLSKVHHCLADGVSANALHTSLFTTGSALPSTQPDHDNHPAPEPGTVRLVLNAMRAMAFSPVDQLCFLVGGLLSPNRLARRVANTARGLTALVSAMIPVAKTSLSGPIGRQRHYEIAHVSLREVKKISRAFEVTVNDVVLAAISGALRELLLHRGEIPAAGTVRALVPVSVRERGEQNTPGNQVSLMLPLLPVDIADPALRLSTVHRRLAKLKESKEAEAGTAITASAQHGLFAPIAWSIRAAAKVPQRNIVTVATNVPGPRDPLFVLGREVVELYPYMPIAMQLRTGVAVLTYRDHMAFGITSDLASVPETGLLAEMIERDIATLAKVAPRPRGGSSPVLTRQPVTLAADS
jgi:diacylglycerol O-acyltransferase